MSVSAISKWHPPRITEATFLALDVEDDSIGRKMLQQFCLEQPVVWDALQRIAPDDGSAQLTIKAMAVFNELLKRQINSEGPSASK